MTRRYPEPVFQTPPPASPWPRLLAFVSMIALLVTVGVVGGAIGFGCAMLLLGVR